MCGIAGFFSESKRFDKEDLVKLTDRLKHRGPDADGFYFDNKVGLGHRRLSILDLTENANQPMSSKDGRYVIIYNGEIYNFKEIATELNLNLTTTSDTEVIIEAFAKCGVEFIHKLNGMFAFAIFDKKERKLFLFRDRIGIKPLFYYNNGESFVFASELKSLISIKKVPLKVNKKIIYTFLHLGYIPEPETIYTEIKKFPTGHYAEITSKGVSFYPYWKIEEKLEKKTTTNLETARSVFKDILESSVKYRMISDVPYGTFLSGGTDSSLITAVAQKFSNNPIKTFTIGFKESKFNEAVHAKEIARYLNTNHHELYVSYKDAIHLTEEIIDTYDEPFADSSAIPTMLVSKMAREHVTMTLSGDGGDELFMGYGSYNWARRLNHPLVKRLKEPISQLLSIELLSDKYNRASYLFKDDFQNSKSHIFSQEQYLFSQRELKELLTKDYHSTFSLELKENLSRKLSETEQQAFFDINYYLKDDLLVKVDRASMKYSLETRVPLLDYRIVEFAINLDEKLKIKNGELKYFLKQILYDYIPKSIMERPKQGFSIPLSLWMKKELKYLINDYLNVRILRKHGVVSSKYVEELVTRFNRGENYLYNRLWVLIMLHKFLEKNNC